MPRFELDRPPVVRVRMTIYFEELASLVLSQVAGFVVETRNAYPDVSERFPLPRISDTNGDEGYASSFSGLPFPLVTMTAADSESEISFQADRFSLTWKFDPRESNKHYPGFKALKAELNSSFRRFADSIAAAGFGLSGLSSQVLYRNSVTELPGAGLALFLLTGRDDMTASHVTDDRTYAGTRIRFPANDERVRRSVSAGVDSPDDDSTMLWIKVSSESEELGAFELLEDAHAELIRRFIQFTPDWLRTSWGDGGSY